MTSKEKTHGYMKSILELWMVLKIPQVGIKQSSCQNRPSNCSMQELSAHSSPRPPQDLRGELQAKQKLPHDLRDLLTEHWAEVAAALEAGEEGDVATLGVGLARLDSDPTLGQVSRYPHKKYLEEAKSTLCMAEPKSI